MTPSNNDHIPREDNEGWELYVAGDNGVDILRYAVKADGILDASRIAQPIVALIANVAQEVSGWPQVTLRGSYIEVTMTAPAGEWFASDQQNLAASIVRVAQRRPS